MGKAATDKEIEKVWNDLWKDLVTTKHGLIHYDKLKRELYDYAMILDEINKAYYEISNGKLSKANTAAYRILSEHEDRIQEALEEVAEKIIKCGAHVKAIKDYTCDLCGVTVKGTGYLHTKEDCPHLEAATDYNCVMCGERVKGKGFLHLVNS